ASSVPVLPSVVRNSPWNRFCCSHVFPRPLNELRSKGIAAPHPGLPPTFEQLYVDPVASGLQVSAAFVPPHGSNENAGRPVEPTLFVSYVFTSPFPNSSCPPR